ncbi:MAG: DedA family protein [Candidatus Omnitrophica bacterium]|nr:DedA family protein [Candidatus Omnitrophota bacterium]
MEAIKYLIDIFLHIDKHLSAIIQNFGSWSYLLLFVIIFAETGLVVTPFLPGDSLIFAVGTLAAIGSMDIVWLFVILFAAAVIGDSVNYAIGKFIGYKAFHIKHSKIFKKEYLDKTHKFYEKYGGSTIILARFVPIVRTFAPFVAGVGVMSYGKFFAYNVIGGFLWVAVFLSGGYFFGNIPIIKENFSIAIFAVVILSVLPIVIEYLKHRKAKKTSLKN